MTLTVSQRKTDKTWEVLLEGTRLLLLRLPQSDQLCVMLNKVFERVIRDRLLQLRVDNFAYRCEVEPHLKVGCNLFVMRIKHPRLVSTAKGSPQQLPFRLFLLYNDLS